MSRAISRLMAEPDCAVSNTLPDISGAYTVHDFDDGFGPEAATGWKSCFGTGASRTPFGFVSSMPLSDRGDSSTFNERLTQFPHPVPLHTPSWWSGTRRQRFPPVGKHAA